ncbi:DUF1449 domain-containing protein [Pseudoteredinibacter isoporae]|uniref:DUF1449 domain-containing protein n=1 Tax=Pseudoteredinibacter isoporae TaxID=570281 RepID=A0A7X0JY04_9GAMM|nr:DUF1449 domain-containing protein [Pseudoteredinibacter isoporae]MBB6523615.1 hypothetical protein [Pseudoteredinibacter isoporae]NHO89122.1 DUF1449 domain-containing protein [Pseudoteredinibacter isoporae]NIB22267.1 DUF1449 domain-containing protein [Pseudoteredinibacter isoporae]
MFAILLSEGMNPFYQNIASFPTVFFTFFLAITVLYWLVAVLGFVDIDILDFDIPDADGSMDVNPDNGLSTPDVLAGFMLRYGLAGVPVTIIVSLIALFGWLACYYIVHFLFGIIPDGLMRYLAGIPVLLVSLYLAVHITAVLIKPLRPLFQKAQQQTVKHILGQTAIVRTSKVDKDFGEVVMEDGGAGLILKARAAGDAVYTKGNRVVLLEHLKEDNLYRVVSEEEFSGPQQ